MDRYFISSRYVKNTQHGIVVISGAKKTDKFKFVHQNDELEITENYRYLGLFFFQTMTLS